MQLNALLRLAFAPAPCLKHLTSLHTITRWVIKQKVRRCGFKPLRLFVDIWFQVLFHSPLGVLFTFPSQYWSTIGHWVVFSLGRWSSQIPTEFHVLRGTWVQIQERHISFTYRTITYFGATFQTTSIKYVLCNSPACARICPATPR